MKGKKPLKDLKKDLLEAVVVNLLKADNQVTTLEVKTELRQKYSDLYWGQSEVSNIMQEMEQSGKLNYKDNGTYRTYWDPSRPFGNQKSSAKPAKVTKVKAGSSPKVFTKVSSGGKISRKKALELMKNNKGRFFTAVFIKKDNTTRVMNCAYITNQTTSDLGYVKVKETSQLILKKPAIRNLNLQTLTELRIGGVMYTIK